MTEFNQNPSRIAASVVSESRTFSRLPFLCHLPQGTLCSLVARMPQTVPEHSGALGTWMMGRGDGTHRQRESGLQILQRLVCGSKCLVRFRITIGPSQHRTNNVGRQGHWNEEHSTLEDDA